MEAAQAAQLQLSGAAEPTFKQLGSSSSKATRATRSDSSSLFVCLYLLNNVLD